ADRIEQACHLAAHQQVLAAVDRGDQVTALGELAKPWPFRRWPRRKARAAGLVGVLMAGLIQARQRAVRRARPQPPVTQEGISLLQCAKRPVRPQTPPGPPPPPQLRHPPPPPILPPP